MGRLLYVFGIRDRIRSKVSLGVSWCSFLEKFFREFLRCLLYRIVSGFSMVLFLRGVGGFCFVLVLFFEI